MIDALTRLVVWLTTLAGAAGKPLLAPVGLLPGWLSATLIAAATGVALLATFKYTSNQRAIQRVKDDIKANLLALKLFNTSAAVALRAQGRVVGAALRLALYSIVPLAVMIVPVTLVLGQLSLWYQARPLRLGEEAVLTLQLDGDAGSAWPEVRLGPCAAVEVTVGPVRVRTQREVCWKLQARQPGLHRLVFDVDGETCEKELAVGDGFMRVSSLRPGWQLGDVLAHPAERPFAPGSPVRSIAIDYPSRPGWASGSDAWVVYWFVVSMAAGFAFRRVLNVNI